MTSTEEAFLLLSTAQDQIAHAKNNRRMGIFSVAISLAYYAAFYAAQAVIAHHREGPKTHRGVSTRFHFMAVVTSDFAADIASFLDELGNLRIKADHDFAAKKEWKERDASDAIAKAEAFVKEVRDWFLRHHRLGEDAG